MLPVIAQTPENVLETTSRFMICTVVEGIVFSVIFYVKYSPSDGWFLQLLCEMTKKTPLLVGHLVQKALFFFFSAI